MLAALAQIAACSRSALDDFVDSGGESGAGAEGGNAPQGGSAFTGGSSSDGGSSGIGGGGIGGSAGGDSRCTPDGEPVLLAEGQLGIEALAADDDGIFWTDHDIFKGRVMRLAPGQRVPTELVPGQTRPFAIAVQGDFVYWTDLLANTVQRVAKSGGMPETLPGETNSPWDVEVTSETVYWVNRGEIGNGSIMGWSPGDPLATPLLSSLNQPIAMRVDDATLWWLQSGSAPSPGLRSAPIDTLFPSTLVAIFDNPRGLALDATRVYVAAADFVVVSSKQSGPFDTLAGDTVGRSLTIEGGYAYWIDNFVGVMRAPVDGGDVEILVSVEGGTALAVDDDCVYWGVRSSDQTSSDSTLWRTDR